MVDAGDVVSHDAISRRGNNHAARKRRMDILRIVLWRQPSPSVLGPPLQHSRQSPRVRQHRGGNGWTILTTQRCPRTTALSNATVWSGSILLNNSTFERRSIAANVSGKRFGARRRSILCWRCYSAPIQIAILAVSGSTGHNHFAIRRRFCAVAARRNSS